MTVRDFYWAAQENDEEEVGMDAEVTWTYEK